MAPLQNSAIERAEILFELELTIFGRLIASTSRLSVNVQAQIARGGKRPLPG